MDYFDYQFDPSQKDESGQVIILTGVYVWKDGTYRDTPEEPKYRITPDDYDEDVGKGRE